MKDRCRGDYLIHFCIILFFVLFFLIKISVCESGPLVCCSAVLRIMDNVPMPTS